MRKLVLLVAAFLGAVASPPLLADAVQTPIVPVQTQSGRVAGMALDSGVRAWLGVPFAKPPINDLRWAPPQPIVWKGVWNADHKAPECMQMLRPHNMNNYFGEEATAENCLYLNIWASPRSKPGDKLPVIVFMHGGGGIVGSPGSPMYDGANIAKKGVVFVTIAFRLGILGGMAHPELTKEQGGHSGNYTYLDQNAALKWLHENIGAFGGDASHLIITGQSAGAGSVAAQLNSPLSKGLFSGAMMSSVCSVGSKGAGTSLTEAEKTGLKIQKLLGASDLADLRNIPADKIVQLQSVNPAGYDANTSLRTGAVIDGYFNLLPKESVTKNGPASDVPIIGNFNSGESNTALQNATTIAEYDAIAAKMYGADAPAFLKLYPVKADADIEIVASKLAREASMANATRNCGVNQVLYEESPAYLSMFNHRFTYTSGVKILDVIPSKIGVYHDADLPYWFGNLDIFNLFRKTREITSDDRKLADEMEDSLIAFAKTGNPGTAAVKWPAWTAKNDVFLNIGDNDIKAEAFNTKAMAWLTAHPSAIKPLIGSAAAPGAVAGVAPRD